jgi:hypothetical protein
MDKLVHHFLTLTFFVWFVECNELFYHYLILDGWSDSLNQTPPILAKRTYSYATCIWLDPAKHVNISHVDLQEHTIEDLQK